MGVEQKEGAGPMWENAPVAPPPPAPVCSCCVPVVVGRWTSFATRCSTWGRRWGSVRPSGRGAGGGRGAPVSGSRSRGAGPPVSVEGPSQWEWVCQNYKNKIHKRHTYKKKKMKRSLKLVSSVRSVKLEWVWHKLWVKQIVHKNGRHTKEYGWIEDLWERQKIEDDSHPQTWETRSSGVMLRFGCSRLVGMSCLIDQDRQSYSHTSLNHDMFFTCSQVEFYTD